MEPVPTCCTRAHKQQHRKAYRPTRRSARCSCLWGSCTACWDRLHRPQQPDDPGTLPLWISESLDLASLTGAIPRIGPPEGSHNLAHRTEEEGPGERLVECWLRLFIPSTSRWTSELRVALLSERRAPHHMECPPFHPCPTLGPLLLKTRSTIYDFLCNFLMQNFKAAVILKACEWHEELSILCPFPKRIFQSNNFLLDPHMGGCERKSLRHSSVMVQNVGRV